ncbi:hypothetical protein NWP10_06870, partial [Micrococcus sp. HG099]|nr:hypothetical protein [Micrococcus sp. HG099]
MTSATSSSPASPAPAAACLVLTLAATAALPDWGGSGVARPLWALLLPAAPGPVPYTHLTLPTSLRGS